MNVVGQMHVSYFGVRSVRVGVMMRAATGPLSSQRILKSANDGAVVAAPFPAGCNSNRLSHDPLDGAAGS